MTNSYFVVQSNLYFETVTGTEKMDLLRQVVSSHVNITVKNALLGTEGQSLNTVGLSLSTGCLKGRFD